MNTTAPTIADKLIPAARPADAVAREAEPATGGAEPFRRVMERTEARQPRQEAPREERPVIATKAGGTSPQGEPSETTQSDGEPKGEEQGRPTSVEAAPEVVLLTGIGPMPLPVHVPMNLAGTIATAEADGFVETESVLSAEPLVPQTIAPSLAKPETVSHAPPLATEAPPLAGEDAESAPILMRQFLPATGSKQAEKSAAPGLREGMGANLAGEESLISAEIPTDPELSTPSGMTVAKAPVPVKTTAKETGKGERTAEVRAPDTFPSHAAGKAAVLERHAVEFATRPGETAADASRFYAPSLVPAAAAPGVERAEFVSAVSSVPRAAVAEALVSRVTEQVVFFRRVGAESMDVSIRADRTTELVLHLSLRNGLVDVAARVERGDFDAMQSHWGELQQSLSHQGVRVSPLNPSSFGESSSFSQSGPFSSSANDSRQSRDEAPVFAEALADLAPDERPHTRPRPSAATAARAAVRQGWVSWA